MSTPLPYYILLCLIIGLVSCADDTNVGSELLGSEDIAVGFTDEISFSMTQLGPDTLCYSRINFHSLGTLGDDITGSLKSAFYTRPLLNPNLGLPSFQTGTYQSIALALRMDSTRYYGSKSDRFDIDVFELVDEIPFVDTFCLDLDIARRANRLGSRVDFDAYRGDSIKVKNIRDSSFWTNILYVPLDDNLGRRLFVDTIFTGSVITEATRGLYVEAVSENAITQIDLLANQSALILTYKDSDGFDRNYQYLFSRGSPMSTIGDISGSRLEEVLLSGSRDETYVLQGLGVASIAIDLSELAASDLEIVNHVALELTVTEERLMDTSAFGLPQSLELLIRDENSGQLVPVSDLETSLISGLNDLFDGSLGSEDGRSVYTMNITTHVKELLKGTVDPVVYLRIRNSVDTPNSVTVYGPNHPLYPAKLNITFTKP